MTQFKKVLANTLIANLSTSYLWFALTFWVFLETGSVFANAVIAGTFMLMMTLTSLFFGTIVDRFKKKAVMVASSVGTMVAYALAGVGFLLVPETQLLRLDRPQLWIFIVLVLAGAIVENLRNIALSTTVTLLVPDEDHARANGMVGTVQGLAFLGTSVLSGLSIGFLGMGWTMIVAIALTAFALLHLLTVTIPEEGVYHDPAVASKTIDLAGSLAAVRAVPGLGALILFTCFNNFIAGTMMALLDPYGLTMFSVQAWGIVLGVTSIGFIVGGLIVSRRGLGNRPVRRLLMVNVMVALVGIGFVLREWHWLFVLGIFGYMLLVPMAEAAEQTIIQRVVPLHRQGRVFGFAQSVETAATPISTFAIGPLAQFWIIPWVASAEGRDVTSWLLGEGQGRGIALVFILASLVMLAVVLLAFRSRAYGRLTKSYAESEPVEVPVTS
jgi:DHA3 family multidrug efflux protein-like MFS transporter